ncbi:MAG TPA: hypothetical protein VF623_04040 [Segetibacter sp.]
MRRRKDYTLGRILKIVALVTAALALIEVAILFFLHSPGKTAVKQTAVLLEKSKSLSAKSPTQIPPKAIKTTDTPKVTDEEPIAIAVSEPMPVVSAATKPKVIKPESRVIDTSKKNVFARLEKDTEMVLSQQDMEEILANVKLEKTRANNFSNCIQVRKTNSSNVSNAFKVADFLRTKGFSISGRMTVATRQKGVAINTEGSCITVTIGSM